MSGAGKLALFFRLEQRLKERDSVTLKAEDGAKLMTFKQLLKWGCDVEATVRGFTAKYESLPSGSRSEVVVAAMVSLFVNITIFFTLTATHTLITLITLCLVLTLITLITHCLILNLIIIIILYPTPSIDFPGGNLDEWSS